MLIDQQVEAGKVLRVGGLAFRGPCHATGVVPDGSEVIKTDAKPVIEATKEDGDAYVAARILQQTDYRMARASEEMIEVHLGLRPQLSDEVIALVNLRRDARPQLRVL